MITVEQTTTNGVMRLTGFDLKKESEFETPQYEILSYLLFCMTYNHRVSFWKWFFRMFRNGPSSLSMSDGLV